MRKLLLLAGALAACTPDFDSPSRVHDLRILAVQAEPPEAAVDFAAGTVQPVKLTALVRDPARTNLPQAVWRVCFPTSGTVRCADDAPIVPQTDDEPPTQRTLAATPELISAAQEDDRLKGFDGIRLQLSLAVDDGDPNGPVWAQKLVVYSSNDPPNHNPVIDHVDLLRDGGPYATFPADAAPCLPVNVEIGVLPRLGSGTSGAETYTTTDLSGKTVTLTESPRYFFYATDPADVDGDTADEPLPGTVQPRGLSRLTAQRPGAGTAWIVVRDGRGGESWVSMPYHGELSCD